MLEKDVGPGHPTEREDYVGKDIPQVDPEMGRPIQNITTVRDNGQDAMVFAGLATNR
jgi:hypothetical protein